MVNSAHSQTRTPSNIIDVEASISAWRVQLINNSIIELRTLMAERFSKLLVLETGNRLYSRERPKSVTEKAKRMTVMIKKGR